jgi:hypothetical protein
MPDSTADGYRRNAEHARDMAKLASTQDLREQWEQIADGYVKLAESSDRSRSSSS